MAFHKNTKSVEDRTLASRLLRQLLKSEASPYLHVLPRSLATSSEQPQMWKAEAVWCGDNDTVEQLIAIM